jgi:hypothetical protein
VRRDIAGGRWQWLGSQCVRDGEEEDGDEEEEEYWGVVCRVGEQEYEDGEDNRQEGEDLPSANDLWPGHCWVECIAMGGMAMQETKTDNSKDKIWGLSPLRNGR